MDVNLKKIAKFLFSIDLIIFVDCTLMRLIADNGMVQQCVSKISISSLLLNFSWNRLFQFCVACIFTYWMIWNGGKLMFCHIPSKIFKFMHIEFKKITKENCKKEVEEVKDELLMSPKEFVKASYNVRMNLLVDIGIFALLRKSFATHKLLNLPFAHPFNTYISIVGFGVIIYVYAAICLYLVPKVVRKYFFIL